MSDRNLPAVVEVEAEPDEIVIPISGELVRLDDPASVARGLVVVKETIDRLNGLRRMLAGALGDESKRVGTKTLRYGGLTAKVSGGPETEIDAETLRDLLRNAGCPEERINAAIKEEISYKVDRNVLRQLRGANENYAAAIDLATTTIEKPYSATVS